ncbi:YqeG family HAD IIIA-type phosphatase [Paenibacillus albiflavus]|uniref:YqeG family HAD IIIA-type phosphatase n=1 Tax=Paenibacillus albiflavus TaxID=2545760 RepID=A0A4V2WNW1_9BACL|nr:YqeG family HAD IIIA-type phosphatase [Paenibacillus albiflavus]TCZ77052.1 YqeG family HAD IIIA-type phosphatase [Paenibacillus albiflavus]
MLKRFEPKLSVRTVYDIDLVKLWEQGYRGIITDLDNTLVGAKEPLATPELISWLESVKEMGFRVVIVSNNNHGRVSAFADPLHIPFIHAARKPTRTPFNKALTVLKTAPNNTIVIGDQLMTDVLGGNRMGLYTILVRPIAIKDEGIATKMINRPLEKLTLKLSRNKRQ